MLFSCFFRNFKNRLHKLSDSVKFGYNNISSMDVSDTNTEMQDEIVKKIKLEPDTEDTEVEPENRIATKKKRGKMEIELDDTFKDEMYSVTDDGKVCKKYQTRKRRQPPQKKLEDRKPVRMKPVSRDYICDICHQRYMTPQALIGHRKSHSKKMWFKCAICNEIFNSNRELIEHKTVHAEEDRTFTCANCKEEFKDHLEYVLHKFKHTKAKIFKCAECGRKDFKHRSGFRIHIETHYDSVKECKICHRSIKTYQFKQHMNTHTSTMPYNTAKPCVECGKMYKPKDLRDHMHIHTGVRPYQCLYCGKGFVRKQARMIHTRIHTNERPYKCRLCDKTFRQLIDCNRHEERHNGKKSLECDACGTKYSDEYALKMHMTIHNNTQKYQCKVCEWKFHALSSLKSHMARNHSEIAVMKCEPCDRSYKLGDYQKHLKSIKHRNNVFGLSLKTKDVF